MVFGVANSVCCDSNRDITSTMDGLYAYNLVVSNPARKAEVQSSLKSKESSKGKESSKSKESIKGATVDLRYDASTSAVKLEELSNEKSQGSKMRRRMQKLSKHDKEVASSPLYSSSAGGASDEEKDTNQHGASSDAGAQADTITPTLQAEEDEPPTYSDSVNEYLLDPMQQFSAFPPVTLRKAQAEFKQSLRLAMALLSEQQRFGGMSTAATQNSVRGHSREKT